MQLQRTLTRPQKCFQHSRLLSGFGLRIIFAMPLEFWTAFICLLLPLNLVYLFLTAPTFQTFKRLP